MSNVTKKKKKNENIVDAKININKNKLELHNGYKSKLKANKYE